MAERLNLASRAQARPGTTTWRLILLNLNWEVPTIEAGFRGDNNEYTSIGYEGTEATNLMVALNKANLSTKSLHRRIMEKAIADGKLSGTISGVPD